MYNPINTRHLCRDCTSLFKPPNNGGIGAGMCDYCYQPANAVYEVEWCSAVYDTSTKLPYDAPNYDKLMNEAINKFLSWRDAPYNVCAIEGAYIQGEVHWRAGKSLCSGCVQLYDMVESALRDLVDDGTVRKDGDLYRLKENGDGG